MKEAKRTRKISSFWLGPLFAGSCLAIGYHSTQRLILRGESSIQPSSQFFTNQKRFPGKSLNAIQKKELKSNFIIDSKTKDAKKVLSKSEKKVITPLKEVQEREMQSLLDSLGANLNPYKESTKVNQGSINQASRTTKKRKSKALPIFTKKKFDALFKTLSDP